MGGDWRWSPSRMLDAACHEATHAARTSATRRDPRPHHARVPEELMSSALICSDSPLLSRIITSRRWARTCSRRARGPPWRRFDHSGAGLRLVGPFSSNSWTSCQLIASSEAVIPLGSSAKVPRAGSMTTIRGAAGGIAARRAAATNSFCSNSPSIDTPLWSRLSSTEKEGPSDGSTSSVPSTSGELTYRGPEIDPSRNSGVSARATVSRSRMGESSTLHKIIAPPYRYDSLPTLPSMV